LINQSALPNSNLIPSERGNNVPLKFHEFSFVKKDSTQPILRDLRMLQGIFEKQNIELVDAREEIQKLRNKSSEKERFQSVLAAVSPDAIIATDKNLNVIEWNKAAEELFGWKTEEALGQAFSIEIRSHVFEAFTKDEVFDGLANQGCWIGNLPAVTRNGLTLSTRVSVGIVWDQDGAFNGLIAVYQVLPDGMIRRPHRRGEYSGKQ
jgi:PAS domain S-box-containing protein